MSPQTSWAKKKKKACDLSLWFCNNKHLDWISYLLRSKKQKALTITKAQK